MFPLGFVFDLDGTLVNTQLPYHATAECIALAERGVEINPVEISERFAGISTRKVFAALAPQFDPEPLNIRKWQIIYELLDCQKFEALPGMMELCQQLYSVGIPMAIASASPRKWIAACLEQTDKHGQNFAQFFADRYVSVEECAHSKPAPDVFLAAKALVPGAEKYIAVGDGVSDVLAGLAAGMDVVYLSSNSQFDGNRRIIRFSNSDLVAEYINSLTMANGR